MTTHGPFPLLFFFHFAQATVLIGSIYSTISTRLLFLLGCHRPVLEREYISCFNSFRHVLRKAELRHDLFNAS